MSELYTFDKNDAFRFAEGVGIEHFAKGDELLFKYCPFCNGGRNKDTRTFSINLAKGTWNCKRGSCGRKGNMITLSQEFDWFSLGDGIDDYYKRRERYRAFVRKPIESNDNAVKYLADRGIPSEITKRYEITTVKDRDDVLVFPFIDENEKLWFIKYRNIAYKKGETKGSKEWCEANRKPILFGMNHCNFENDVLVMTEGQIDSLSCAAAGVENAVSVPTGKNGFTWIPYCWNFLGRFNELIIFGDYENGEISLLKDMKTRFHGRIKHVRPEDYRDCKDANEILQKYGADAVRQCVENAEAVPVPGLKRIVDIQRVTLSEIESMDTGIKAVDEKCRFYFGELNVLTGAAGDGKSTMASQWVTRALDQGYPSMIYSGELPAWQVKNWLDFQTAGKANLNSRNDIVDETYELIKNWDMYQRLYVYEESDLDDDQKPSGELIQHRLLDVIRQGIQQYGIRFIVIDNLMTAMDNDGKLELNQAQTEFTKKLANIAQTRNVIIVLVVHPRKGRASGGFSNDDIAGSSNIVNRAHKTVRYSRPDKPFVDANGRKWEADELYDCPIRMLTVMKDRFTGNTLHKGIPLYFESCTKRISDTQDEFNWRLKWEGPDETDGFQEVDFPLPFPED